MAQVPVSNLAGVPELDSRAPASSRARLSPARLARGNPAGTHRHIHPPASPSRPPTTPAPTPNPKPPPPTPSPFPEPSSPHVPLPPSTPSRLTPLSRTRLQPGGWPLVGPLSRRSQRGDGL
jgi:hypothetical protein